jgi:hypothetical protein
MSRSTSALKTATLVVLAVVAGALASTSSAEGTTTSANQLAGTWQVIVNRPAPLPPLRSLQIFTSDGSAIETSNEAPSSRSPLYSSWERNSGRLYSATGVHFLYNPATGEFVGTRKINRTIELSEDGQSFAAIARVTTLDPNGNVLGSGTATASGERLLVEQIPAQP